MSLSKFFGTENFNLQQITTPFVGTKKGLLFFRIISFLILIFGFIVAIYNYYYNFNTNELRIFLPYFTHQSFIAILIYFLINIVLQIKDLNNTLPKRFKNENLNVTLHVFYNSIVPLAFLVSFIFWFMIYPILDFSRCNILNYCQHLILHLFQSIFIGIDWYLTTIPTSRNHYIPMTCIGIIYLIYAQFYHVIYGDWIYDFLDTSNKYWIIIYVCVIIFWIIFGIIFTKIHQKKNKFININND
ncbi:hypothetical protein BCR32DRAFT_268154 [Anaeromyces robustus]|uniref:FAR-17a/AIG1-like protein n=1 Tax=Anaeromyces robustus TaxID=1754192 RepID=A0A1Y1X784_9FUNG|nr:hypothetical protein BCR32DRAFT_268154 [Anaeromyces robustus]|eukprot:ORX81640.1 hypothetical protein BCR32DRAFT_268154 [Anaeromyces robustus]